jgi:adenine-specific DNA-methyltransferase
MAAIDDLLQQITDPKLRKRLEMEIRRLSENKKFGLVFEEHIPECTPLYDIPVRRGRTVAKKNGKISEVYKVLKISGGANFRRADCLNLETSQVVQLPVEELVSVACFGDPIFPSLEPVAKVENAPKDSPWHTIIEADNFHALQLLAYLYPKQVDCIYIDPPYNTGARDWKYNNDYVDASDAWRHSKWLSMMQKRLQLSKRLLSFSGVIATSISYHELNHLVVLCEELFPEKQVVVVTIQTSTGKPAGGFNLLHEYLVFVVPPDFKPNSANFVGGNKSTPFHGMTLASFNQTQRPNQVYPIFIDKKNGKIVRCGLSLQERVEKGIYRGRLTDFKFDYNEAPRGTVAVWPVSNKGNPCVWRLISSRLMSDWDKGYIKVISTKKTNNLNLYNIQYLSAGIISKVENGILEVTKPQDENQTIEIHNYFIEGIDIPSILTNKNYFTTKGTQQIQDIFGFRAFQYPKPFELIAAIIGACSNKNSLIVDFFAGSGTTLHAVNLLNAEDGGSRQCILVTNNEVSEQEAKSLRQESHAPGDAEWEKHGICRSVTWPRTEYSILGRRGDGSFLEGDYYTNQTVEKEEARLFFQLGFIEDGAALSVADKKQIISLLRSKEGKNLLPQTLVKPDSAFIVSDKHAASILFDCSASDKWLEALEDQDHITEFYIPTKDNAVFASLKEKVSELLGPVIVSENLKRPMKDGFASNVEYFKLGFLDRENVSLGRQFREILPLLWLKAGAIGNRPKVPKGQIPDMLVLPQNSFAILTNEELSSQFIVKLKPEKDISTVYVVTNSESAYRHIASQIKARKTYQLYRDYIDNFILGVRSDAP